MTMTHRAAALVGAMLATAPAMPVAPEYWSASWAASPAPPLAASPGLPAGAMARAFKDQTIGQIVHLSSGGTGLRLRFTNEYGMKPLRIGAAQVALVDANRGTIGGTKRTVTFGGHAGVLIPAGAPWVSDPIDLPVPTSSRLQISLYLPEDTGLCTCHADGGETATISEGDFTRKPFIASATFTARAFRRSMSARHPHAPWSSRSATR